MLVDVHAHLYPEGYLERLRQHPDIDYALVPGSHESYEIFGGLVLWIPNPQPSVTDRIETMDGASIDRQLVSLGPLGVAVMGDGAPEVARMVNDEFLTVAARAPERFGVLATLPFQDVQASLTELERLAAEDAVAGVGALTNVDGLSLVDQRLDPIWEALDEQSRVVLVHPTLDPGPYAGPHPDLALAVGFPHASIEALLALVLAGHHRRYPRIKWVFCHLGGGLTANWDRITSSLARIGAIRPGADLASELGGQVYFDCVTTHGPGLRCFVETLGVGSLVLGTDFPHVPTRPILEALHAGDDTPALLSAIEANGAALLAPDRSGLRG